MAERGKLHQIPADMIDSVWSIAQPYLLWAQVRIGSAPPDEFRARLDAGECDLWLITGEKGAIKGAGITSIKNLTTVTVEALGGEGIHWRALLRDLEDLARKHGKKRMEIKGRPGWARMFRDDGYRTSYVTIRKAL